MFNYHDYAMYFNNTNLKDQGSTDFGAGNRFYTDMTTGNHQLRYNGSAMTYYCDPESEFVLSTSGGLTASSATALDEGQCATYSGRIMQSVTEGADSRILLDCMPNPASDEVTFIYDGDVSANAEVVVRDILGRPVETFTIVPGASRHVIKVGNWANGLYFYSMVRDGKVLSTQKLIITK